MANAMKLDSVQDVDREITKSIRRLAWLQELRDDMAGVKHRGPRGPKGPVTMGETKLHRSELSVSEQKIVDALKTYPHDEWSVGDLLEATKLNRNTLVNAISRIVRTGHLHRVGRGFYQLNPELAHDEE